MLTTIIAILLVFNSTSGGISSTTFFQNGLNDVNQNNIKIMNAFASPEEEAGESNNNDEASEEDQGLSEEEAGESNNNDEASEEDQGLQGVTENITTVNPSLATLSQPPQNEQCPAGSPPGCYVKPPSREKISCEPGEMILQNVPGGPDGTMCAPIPPEECPAGSPPGCYVKPPSREKISCEPGEMILQNVPGGPDGTMCAPIQPSQNQDGLPNSIGVNETLQKDNTLTIGGLNPEGTVANSSPASCNSQGTLFDPITNMCKNPQSIQDCAKIMQMYDPNQGICINRFIS
jgi:hypothetical protein